MGSSPRVRGEGYVRLTVFGKKGIIPAGAGRSLPRGGLGAARGDHPRGCGEKSICESLDRTLKGSSPRVRGEAVGTGSSLVKGGIIPAGAGRSGVCHDKKGRRGDHPRGCGEKPDVEMATDLVEGSSPRVRGEAIMTLPFIAAAGIIPAGAGRRRGLPRRRPRQRDHPRGCGEKSANS